MNEEIPNSHTILVAFKAAGSQSKRGDLFELLAVAVGKQPSLVNAEIADYAIRRVCAPGRVDVRAPAARLLGAIMVARPDLAAMISKELCTEFSTSAYGNSHESFMHILHAMVRAYPACADTDLVEKLVTVAVMDKRIVRPIALSAIDGLLQQRKDLVPRVIEFARQLWSPLAVRQRCADEVITLANRYLEHAEATEARPQVRTFDALIGQLERLING